MTQQPWGGGRSRGAGTTSDLLTRTCVWLAGADWRVAQHTPTEWGRFCVVAFANLTAATFGFAAGMVATGYLAHTTSLPAKLAGGLLASAVMISFDRGIQATSRKGQNLKLITCLRIGFSLVYGALISEMLMQYAFDRDIRSDLTQQRMLHRRQAERRAQESADTQRVQELESRNTELAAQVGNLRPQRDAAYRAFIAEADGSGGSGRPGKGPLYDDKKAEFARAEEALRVAAQSVTEEKARNNAVLDTLRQRQQEELRRLDADEAETAGSLIAREKALHRLILSDVLVFLKYVLIWLFLMLIDLMPLGLKLTQRGNRNHPYDDWVEAEEQEAIQEAHLLLFQTEQAAHFEQETLRVTYKALLDQDMALAELRAVQIADARHRLMEAQIDNWEQGVLQTLATSPATTTVTSASPRRAATTPPTTSAPPQPTVALP